MRLTGIKNWQKMGILGVLIAVLFLAHSVIFTSVADAAINRQINFQGKFANKTVGTNIPNGNYNMEFKIYSGGDGVPGGGDETLLWTESRLANAGNQVAIADGIFQVNLGSVTALPGSIDFDTATLWLSINLGSTNGSCTPFSSCTPDGEMNPMVRFTAAPYAFNADKLDGLDSTAFARTGANNAFTGTQTITGSSAAQLVVENSSNKDILTVDASGSKVVLGQLGNTGLNGELVFNSATAGNYAVTLKVSASQAASYDLLFPTAAPGTAQCLKSGATTASQLEFATCGGGGGTLNDAYTADVDGSNTRIDLTSADDSIIFSNPTAGGSDTSYVLKVEQLNTSTTKNTLLVSHAGGTGSYALRVNDDGTDTDTSPFIIGDTGQVGIGSATPGEKLEVVGNIISKGTEWTSRTSAADNNWRSVAYGNGLFVAVAGSGTGNRVMTSPDGINWATRTSAADDDWRSVAYGNGLFVAVSVTGTVMTSPNGISWTTRTAAAANQWKSVAYGNGKFVAVSVNGVNQVMTSRDGINWTSQSAATAEQWYSVTYGNGKFVAVSNSSTSTGAMTSPDGITWTSQTLPANRQWQSVTYGNGLFVAVAFSGSDGLMTSPDGIAWTLQTTPIGNGLRAVTYGNGLFVAVSEDPFASGHAAMTSPDGVTWTLRTGSPTRSWQSVVYGNGLFVAVATSGTGDRVMSSGKTDYIPFSSDNKLNGGLTVTGTTTLQSGSNATSSFQVQNAANIGILTVDTTNGELEVGTAGSSGIDGKIVLHSTHASNYGVTLAVANTLTESYTLTLPNNDGAVGECLKNDASTTGLLVWGSCGGASSTTLQQAYDFGATGNANQVITLDADQDSLIVRNPAASGSSSTFVLKVEQLNTGAVDGMIVTHAGTGLAFRVNDDGTDSDTTPFAIDQSGNVGIGTASPSAKVELKGGTLLTKPTNPTHVGAILDNLTTELDSASGITVVGGYAYVTAGTDDGVEILDISNPAAPTHVGAITDDLTTELDGANDIVVVGKYAYIASNADDGVEILDISNPAAPVHVGAITDDGTTELDGAAGIEVVGKYAYVASDVDDGVEILDISNPAAPTHVGAITDDLTTELDGAKDITIVGKYAYVASLNDNGVEILDISNPAAPTHVGAITDDVTTILGGATRIQVLGKYAYIASFNEDGVEILDISNPAAPTHVGAITDDATTELDGANDITVAGNYAYIPAIFDDGVEILDISNPAAPTHVGAITDDGTTALDAARRIAVVGKYAYTSAATDDGVEVLDIGGGDLQAANIGTLRVATASFEGQVYIGNLTIQSGLGVGIGGIKTEGAVTAGGALRSGGNGVNGQMILGNSSNTNTMAIQSGATAGGNLTLILPTTIGASNECLKNSGTAGTLTFGSCGAAGGDLNTSYAADADGSDAIIALTSTDGAILIRDASSALATAFAVQNNGGTANYLQVTSTGTTLEDTAGNDAFVFDTANSVFRVYENVATPSNHVQIYYASGEAVFAASSGNTRIGSGSGDIVLSTTANNDELRFTHTGSGAYSGTDATITRTITGAAGVQGGAIFKITDTSTANGGVAIDPTLLLINQAATGGTVGGALIDAQLAGVSKFLVTKDGLTIAAAFISSSFDTASATGLFIGNSNANAVSISKVGVTTTIQGALNVVGGYSANGTAGVDRTCTSGEFLQDQVVIDGIVTGGTCAVASGGGTLQTAYDSDTAGTPADIITTSAAKTILVKAGVGFDAQALFEVQTSTAGPVFKVDTETTTDPLEVQIGDSTDDSAVVFLGLDNETTFAETATCNAAINGSIYYNGTTNAVRACVNGAWEDMVSTAALGLQLFGVVPDSGSSPGDLASVTGAANGPCKVQWASATTVSIAACTAYSGGRKVIVAAVPSMTIASFANNNFIHICLDSTGVPAQSASGTEVANLATVSMPSVTAPLLCLADVKTTGVAIADLYDTRTFTTSTKETATINSNAGLGFNITGSATVGVFASAAATTATHRGVVVATTGAAATTTINAIIATSGPAWVKASAGTVNQYILPTATAGYVNTSGTVSATGLANLGLATTTFDTTCSTTANCRGSIFTSLKPR